MWRSLPGRHWAERDGVGRSRQIEKPTAPRLIPLWMLASTHLMVAAMVRLSGDVWHPPARGSWARCGHNLDGSAAYFRVARLTLPSGLILGAIRASLHRRLATRAFIHEWLVLVHVSTVLCFQHDNELST